MPQGNFVAYQALKPAELKVGDYYQSFVDDYIKRGDAEKAAQAKLLADTHKNIGDRFALIKFDPFASTAGLQDFANQSFRDTADYVGKMRMAADNDPKNAAMYIDRANRAANDYLTLSTSFGNKDFIDKYNAKMEALANHDVFSDTDTNQQLAMLGHATPITKRNEDTGAWEFYMPDSSDATDDQKMIPKSVGQMVGLFTNPDQINLLQSNKSNGNNGFLDKQVFDIAKTMRDEYDNNFDGNRENAKKWFSADRGNLWFDSRFGAYNPNKIDPIVEQYAKQVLKKSINGDDAEAVYNEAKKGLIDNVAALVGTSVKTDTKDSALDIAIKQQELENKRIAAQKMREQMARDRAGGGSGGGSEDNNLLGNGTISTGNVVLNVGAGSHFNTQGVSYFPKGAEDGGKTGITAYWNPNAKGANKGGISYAVNLPSKDGKQVVMQGINAQRAAQILAGNKVENPQGVLVSMANTAIANGYNKPPTPIGNNISNYKVDFTPSYNAKGGGKNTTKPQQQVSLKKN